jgi:hypothetical protein
MARRKDLYPILIVSFEDKVYGFPKRIPLYFMNAWFERYFLLKLTNFNHLAKISQNTSACNSLGNVEAQPWVFRKIIFGLCCI